MFDQANTELIEWLTSLKEMDHTKIISASLQTLLDELRGQELNIDKVCTLLAAEPILCAKLLMIANSSFFGFSRQIERIEEAVVIIGAAKLRSLIYTAALLQNTDNQSVIVYIKHSLTTALFCKAIAEELDQDADQIYLLGLLHLLPVIANFHPDIDGKLSTSLLREASAILLEKIGLPKSVCHCITNLFEPETSNNQTRVLKISFTMAIIQLVDDSPFSELLSLESDFEMVGISPEKVAGLCARVESEQNSLFGLLG